MLYVSFMYTQGVQFATNSTYLEKIQYRVQTQSMAGMRKNDVCTRQNVFNLYFSKIGCMANSHKQRILKNY